MNIKIIAVAMIGFGSNVFAGAMGPVCMNDNVTVPCPQPAWEIGIQALYLQTSYSQPLGYLGDVTPAPFTHQTFSEGNPQSWGFKLEGALHFNTGNDLNINWYHLGNHSNTVYAHRVFGFFQRSSDPILATINPGWDAVNFEFGQHVDFGQFKNIRFHGGVQYARLQTEINRLGVLVNPAPGDQPDYVNEDSKYSGFGPRIGADMSYDVGRGFAIYGKGATSILAGTGRYNQVVGNPLSPITRDTVVSKTMLVPEVEAKLGLSYTAAVANGNWMLDIGYMWVNYFNAQPVAGVNSVDDSNFSLHGPYAGLKWIGTMA